MHAYDYDLLVKILIAALLGAIIGFEREKSKKPAGIRTQMLISVGSALLAGISIHLGREFNAVNADPARLMAQVVSGIGFLGAGVIIKESSSHYISGVTTAATIWVAAAVGIAVGSGYYPEAILCTMLVLLLMPLAKAKRLAGVGMENYTMVIHEKHWKQIAEILKKRGIECEIWKTANETTRLKFYTSQAIRHKLTVELHEARIAFEIVDDSTPTLFG